MRVLIVEDDVNNIHELESVVLPKYGQGEIYLAKSRDSAINLLEQHCFDAVLLDRKIPSSDGQMDEDVIYGEVVYSHIMKNFPGTLIRFWSAFLKDEYISEKIDRDVRHEDVWGNGITIATVGIIPKSRYDLLCEFLDNIKNQKNILNAIEIRVPPDDVLTISSNHKKILRIFARIRGGRAIEVANVTGGLSSSSVVRTSVYNGRRKIVTAIGKLSNISQVRDESLRQRRINGLAPGSFTALLEQVKCGAGGSAGTFYKLADSYKHSLFELLHTSPESMDAVVDKVKLKTSPWNEAASDETILIRDLRRQLVSDEIFNMVLEMEPGIADFENLSVDISRAVQHSDLHGANILLDDEHNPILIDYGDIQENHAALDPITLELSNIFHPAGFRSQTGWPTLEQAENWCDLSTYLIDCPIASFITKCRNWAYETAPANRSFYAMSYVFLLKQFKYPNTDKDVALVIIKAILKNF